MPYWAIILKIILDRLFSSCVPSRKWLAVVASVGKILPDVRRKLPKRVAKFIEARIGDRQIPLRVEIVPLQNLVSAHVLSMFSISVPQVPNNSRHESDGSPTDPLDVGLAIVAKVPCLSLDVVGSCTGYGFKKRSVSAAAYVPVVDTTNRL